MRISSDKEINLNDNVVDQYGNAVIVNKGADVTIKNGTIKDVGSSKAVDIEFGSQVTFENVKFEMTTDSPYQQFRSCIYSRGCSCQRRCENYRYIQKLHI